MIMGVAGGSQILEEASSPYVPGLDLDVIAAELSEGVKLRKGYCQ